MRKKRRCFKRIKSFQIGGSAERDKRANSQCPCGSGSEAVTEPRVTSSGETSSRAPSSPRRNHASEERAARLANLRQTGSGRGFREMSWPIRLELESHGCMFPLIRKKYPFFF